ncbi:MAG: MBL fold metallo-hydrolase [Promethearchaeota archaeon]
MRRKNRLKINSLVGLVLVICIFSVCGLPLFWFANYQHMRPVTNFRSNLLAQASNDTTVYEYNGVEMRWTGVSSFQFRKDDLVVYVDPINLVQPVDQKYFATANIIIVTHDHTPHCSGPDAALVADENKTTVITVGRAFNTFSGFPAKEIKFVRPNDTVERDNIILEFVPAYNIVEERLHFHPKELEYLGVIIDFGGVRIYHAGDTDHIPEMATFNVDIAILPVSGNAWMTAREAAEAVESLKVSSDLKAAIPTHYGPPNFSGTVQDALNFQKYANTTVIILDLYTGEEHSETSQSSSSVSMPGFGWFVGIITLGVTILILKHYRVKSRRF